MRNVLLATALLLNVGGAALADIPQMPATTKKVQVPAQTQQTTAPLATPAASAPAPQEQTAKDKVEEAEAQPVK